MDKFKVETITKIAAIEQLLVMTMAVQYNRLGYTPDSIKDFHSRLIAKARMETFPGADPAIGDMAAGEYAEHVEDLLSRVSDLLAAMGTQQ